MCFNGLQIEEREAWGALGYDQGFTAARDDAEATIQSLIVAHLTSRTQHCAVNAALKVTVMLSNTTQRLVTILSSLFSVKLRLNSCADCEQQLQQQLLPGLHPSLLPFCIMLTGRALVPVAYQNRQWHAVADAL